MKLYISAPYNVVVYDKTAHNKGYFSLIEQIGMENNMIEILSE